MVTATVTTGIDRTGPAVRVALATLDQKTCTRFEAEFSTAIGETNPDPQADAAWA